jgi:para-aminobenzoate synthetase component II
MLALIDNFDSFTYNLVQYLGEMGAELKIFRSNQIDAAGLEALKPDALVISPGPCTPKESGISCAAISHFSGRIPVLGVCLGHQCIGEVFGGKVVRAPIPMHGKMSRIEHNGQDLFWGIENPCEVVRYHSLIIEKESLPDCLEITATGPGGLIMGVRHREHPTFGLQFHPESIFTGVGKQVLKNFLAIVNNGIGNG